eukprot:10968532-Alexandrium_andersonii.AAC.1
MQSEGRWNTTWPQRWRAAARGHRSSKRGHKSKGDTANLSKAARRRATGPQNMLRGPVQQPTV